MYIIFWILILTHVKEKHGLPQKKAVECGYKQCPQTRDGALNVHLIAHSHMDAGWVKTFDEYYYGSNTGISSANVQVIYHSVLSELLHDKRRKFTFSESGYFWRWWKEQRPATRATFRSLVQEGRIEFAGGGWVQSDEATTDYVMLLDQYTWGLRKLNDTLGPCGKPKAAWQIDSYGHTKEHTSLLAQMGYDGLFIGRVDHRERDAMLEEDRMEFMWRGSEILGKMSDIMTHTLYNLYNAPEGFCFDFLCNEEPIVDDPDNRVYNAEKRVSDFISQIERQAKYYEHDNIMVTMGGDFTYQSAAHWYMNMDKLINHVNTHPANISDVNIFYSTPSCYLKALYLYGRRDKAIYTERGELLPYGSDASTYWTGFYTSRPSTKYLVRQAHAFLQVAKQLTVITRMSDSYELHLLRHAVALMMHHDAITGTSQQHVANDFIRTISEAVDAASKKVSNLLSYLTPTWGGTRRAKTGQQFMMCHMLNMSQCKFAENQESILLIVYNPGSVKSYYFVRLPAIALHFSIRNPTDEEVEYQLVPLPTPVINLPGRTSTSLQELVFEAENVPPLGYLAYHISPIRDQLEENEYAKKQTMNPELEKVSQISNEYLKVTINKDTGLLESIQHVDGIKLMISQNFYFYAQGRQTLQSGAYSFRPEHDRPTQVTNNATYSSVRGLLVKEIRQRFNDWIHQTLRLYRGEEFLEVEWVIGPVPIGHDLGKEIVTIFSTNVSNRGEFYTDSNMRQVMKRSCKNESGGQISPKPVASCYYPVASRICINSFNSSTGICVLPDRTQGGTSHGEGEIELMVHRRLLTDDGFGLEESLNEEENGVGLIIRGKHRVLFGNYRQEVDELSFNERMSQAAHRWKMEPWQFLASGDKINRRKWQNVRNKRFSALRPSGLPRHVRVLTLEPWKTGSVLLRLENTMEKSNRGRAILTEMSEDLPKSAHVTVELRKVFQHLQIKSVRETTLGANQWLEEARQMDWSTRYVYTGGDDGLLAEDLDYTEDNKSKQTRDTKDSVRYSEEDLEPGRKQHRKFDKTKSKARPSSYDVKFRRKRNINGTNDFIENVINYDYNNTERIRLYTTEKSKVSDKFIDKVSDATDNVDFTDVPGSTAKEFFTLTPKSIVFRKPLPRKREYSYGSSEEDMSSNMMKRKRKKSERKKRPATVFSEVSPDDADDGVTKSIYEMYYKTRVKVNFKPMIRSNEEVRESTKMRKRKLRKFRSKEFDSPAKIDRSRMKNAKRNVKNAKLDMPFLSGGKMAGDRGDKRGEDAEEDEEKNVDLPFFMGHKRKSGGRNHELRGEEGEEEEEEKDNSGDHEPQRTRKVHEEEEEEEEEKEEKEERRKKRAITKEDEARPEPPQSEPEPDFIVTLRPTQIRSFVIRFHSVKKQYVI